MGGMRTDQTDVDSWILVDQGKSATRISLSGDTSAVRNHPGFHLAPGMDPVRGLVDDVVRTIRAAGLDEPDRGLAVGTTGAPPDRDTLDAVARAVRDELGLRSVLLCEDAVACHLAAFPGGHGSVVSAGTGTVALYADDRRVRKSDGWGPLLGDEGSGYWLGRAGLRAAIAASERRGAATALVEAAAAHLGGLDAAAARRVETAADPIALMVGFVPAMIRAADDGDDVAERLLSEAGRRIAEVALSAVPADEPGPVPVRSAGRLVGSTLVEEALRRGCEEGGAAYLGPVESTLDGVARLPLLSAENPLSRLVGRS